MQITLLYFRRIFPGVSAQSLFELKLQQLVAVTHFVKRKV
jgi:hypothetical protein